MDQNCRDFCEIAYSVPAYIGDKRVLLRIAIENTYFTKSNPNSTIRFAQISHIRDVLTESEIQSRVFDRNNSISAPYHAQVLNYNTSTLCGGAAIAPHFVITAAHCVKNHTDSDSRHFYISIGSLIKEDGILFQMSKIISHKNYLNNTSIKGGKMSHDIALIFVEEKISDENIIGLANRAERVGESGKLTGFGEYKDLGYDSRFLVKLQEANFTVLEDRFDDMPTVFATSGRVGEADNGGPFVWEENGNPVLGGIYTGIARLEGGIKRSMFIRIIDLKHWITYQMKKIL